MLSRSRFYSSCEMAEQQKNELMKKLSKRLAYLLRYGAVKENLDVYGRDYVKLDDAIKLNLLQDYTREEVLKEVQSSVSYRNTQRYEWMEENGTMYIRAAYLRNFEKNPCHKGTNVNTLYECSMSYVMNHLDEFDLSNFPDEDIIRTIMRRLKRQKLLNSKSLKALLVPTVTRLDLEGVYLTSSMLRAVWTQCPHLVAVSLQNCGYIMTDHMLTQFVKNLPSLQRLNLCGCDHLTPKFLSILSKWLSDLQVLHVGYGPVLTPQAVAKFLEASKNLTFLDVYYLSTTEDEYETLTASANEKNINLIIRLPKVKKLSENEIIQGEENIDEETVEKDNF